MSKVVLITGASSGFGKQLALSLLAKDYIVYGAARRTAEMQELIDRGGYALPMDVTNTASISRAVAEVVEQSGRIDVLVNNAGLGVFDFVETANLEQMKAMFDVNLWGLVAVTQQVLPQMRTQESGRIINISSVVGQVSSAVLGFYAASKHAVEAISDAMRQEVGRFNIKVAIIEPGVFSTEFDEVLFKGMNKLDAESVYRPMLERFQRSVERSYARAPQPTAVVSTITDAIESRNPKTRYIVGTDAKSAITASRLLSDKAIDKLILSQL